MTITLLLVILFAALAGAAVGIAAYRLFQSISALRAQLDRLENAALRAPAGEHTHQRNPYRTNNGLEDAMAIVHDAVWQADATLDYVRSRMRQVDKTLQTIRSEPDRYDSEQPNQKGRQ